MRARPQIVTIIAWALILKGALFCVFRLSLIGNPFLHEALAKARLPVALQYLETFGSYAFVLAAGIYLLRGENWARWAFVYWSGASFLFSILNEGFRLAPFVLLLINGIVIFLLVRSPAAEFFQADQPRGLLR